METRVYVIGRGRERSRGEKWGRKNTKMGRYAER